MCQINFSIQYTDADGDTLQAAEGRYKLKSVATFSPVFNINLSNPKTPDIKVNGVYDLEVRVQDVKGLWSNWFTSSQGFKIGDCNTTPNGLAITLLEGTCSASNPASSFTYYVSDYNIKNGNIIYSDKLLTTPLNRSPNQNYYFAGTFGASERGFSVGINGVVSNMSFCGTNIFVGALEVNDCDSNSGQNNLVDITGNGQTIGDKVYSKDTITPFNGGNKWYRFTFSGNEEIFYPNLNILDITAYIARIDSNGNITEINNC